MPSSGLRTFRTAAIRTGSGNYRDCEVLEMVVQIDFLPVEINRPQVLKTDLCYKTGENALAWMREINCNVVTPAYVLRRLAVSSDPELRMAVADHLNTPEEVLLLLADDDNADVRYAIADNHNISRNVLNKLRDDPNPYVSHRAQTTLTRLSNDDSRRLNSLRLAQSA